jgi:hypothetical protein
VLFDERAGTLHHLDPVATIVWTRLDGSITIDALAGELSAAFGAERERVFDDLLAFTRQLGIQQLLSEQHGPPLTTDGEDMDSG